MSPQSLAPEHLRFAVLAVDAAIFTINDGELLVRLIPVERPPHFVNAKGLPGGLVHPNETAEDAALRQVEDKAHIDSKHIYIEQLATFSEVKRDPRGRVVAVAYLALAPWEKLSPEERAGDSESWWAPATKPGKLAYDHTAMLAVALKRLCSRVGYTTVVKKLMPKEFTLTELEKAYEAILGKNLDKRNFRKKILKLNILTELPNKRTGGKFRPAQLYTFTTSSVDEIEVL